MMDEEDESDEDEQFLQSAMEIVEELSKGGKVSPLMEHLKIPKHSFDSGATECIYNVLKVIEHGSQSDPMKSFPTSRSSSPFIRSCSTDRTLCLSPTKQIGSSLEDMQEINGNVVEELPRLSLDSQSSQSVYRPPLSGTNMSTGSLRIPNLECSHSHCCEKRHLRSGNLNISGFLYLIIFGLGASVLFYYLYFPPLYNEPVF